MLHTDAPRVTALAIPLPSPLTESKRATFEALIEAHLDAAHSMMAALDAADGDDDLEPSSDPEPSLGWSAGMGHGNTLDLEMAVR